jgi:ankyrin repeat protein
MYSLEPKYRDALSYSVSCTALSKIFDDRCKLIPNFDILSCNYHGYTHLHDAISFNNISLIKHIVNIDKTTLLYHTNGTTPLHLIINYRCEDNKSYELAELLLKLGCPVNLMSEQYPKTPLDFVLEHDKLEIAMLYFRHGSKSDIRESSNFKLAREKYLMTENEKLFKMYFSKEYPRDILSFCFF